MTRLILPVLATAAALGLLALRSTADDGPTEAPAGFTLVTNGLTTQEEFDANLAQFNEDATAGPSADGEGGLGPTYNATSCFACHNNPVAGGGSQIAELRVGHFDGTTFTAPPGGTLVRQRAIDPAAQQRVPDGFEVRARRMSTSLFGLGYVEVVSDVAILAVQAAQPPEMRGTALLVTVTTGVNPDGSFTTAQRFGRFGWKCQVGSLDEFALEANFKEKGITSVRFPQEDPDLDGQSLTQFDHAPDPEDKPTADAPLGKDAKAYTRFMRALRVPPRDYRQSKTDDARAGERLFGSIGCATCHTPTWTTAPPGSTPRGSQAVPDALGSKTIHPFSDLMLHDIGTGDGIDQGGGPDTRNKMRTALLWGLRARPELMHDGLSYTVDDAIQRHAGQAAAVRDRYRALTDGEKRQLRTFLLSL